MSSSRSESLEPPYLYPEYRSTELRAPRHEPVRLAPEWFHRATGPAFGRIPVKPEDADLTRQHQDEPLGERIIVTGRVLDSSGRPVRHTLVEVWQANVALEGQRKAEKRSRGRMPARCTSTSACRVSPRPSSSPSDRPSTCKGAADER